MSLATHELRRRPGRFAVATVVLTFLSLLLLLLGGLLDGLFLGSTGAIRAQDADVIVYSDTARDSFLRSRITGDVRALVSEVEPDFEREIDRLGSVEDPELLALGRDHAHLRNLDSVIATDVRKRVVVNTTLVITWAVAAGGGERVGHQ